MINLLEARSGSTARLSLRLDKPSQCDFYLSVKAVQDKKPFTAIGKSGATPFYLISVKQNSYGSWNIIVQDFVTNDELVEWETDNELSLSDIRELVINRVLNH